MTIDPSVQPGAFDGRRPVNSDEVLRLRRTLWADGSVSPDEAAELFVLNAAALPSNEWTDFFVEALCEYLIARGGPRNHITDADADWLIAQIDRDGRIESHAELELLVKLFERADSVPDSLKQFALHEIEETVLTGSGPTRRGGDIVPGQIGDAEAQLLRRLVFSPASDGPARVSASEADLLFRLKDATLGAVNAPDWQRLFVQGIANHLMAYGSSGPVESEWRDRLFVRCEAPRDPFEQALVDFIAEDRLHP
jgi:hypothetical protein